MNEPEGLQFVDQALCVSRRLRLVFRLKHVRQEGDDRVFGLGCLEKQFQDRDGRGVQQVGVPGEGIEDDGFVVEVTETQPFDSNEAHPRRSFRSRVGHYPFLIVGFTDALQLIVVN